MAKSVTVAEAAEMLGLTHQQVLNRIYRKKLRARKYGWKWRVHLSSLLASLGKTPKITEE